MERPEWYDAYCRLCDERCTNVVKLPASGCGCEAELVACSRCLMLAVEYARLHGAKEKDAPA